ncbi:hypothetical protein BTO28_11305 [Domibacillus epiphyticus]|uniref:SbsA Ig-like domain-containing protein n=1 Tax=Domibacillus epiphyticus TaxID=1714355 RepID=A0A1V2A6U8_9BACI|nr:hypothetical protein BTO28_11305 [Domibacillus epiphyticus]
MFTNEKDGAFKANTVSLSSIDGQPAGTLTGKLSADGKTLTVTSQNVLSKRYDVVVDGVKTTDAKDVAKYEEMITIAADKTAPTILGTERISAAQVKVKFSEPMKAFSSVTFKYADGTTVSGVTGGIANSGDSEAVFTMDPASVTANKEIVATFIGAQDQAGNLLTPNPANVSFVRGAADGVAPTVSSITQVGATKFAVKFSEQILAKPVVKVNGTTVDAASVVQDTNDTTQYIVTAPAVLDGATTVAIESFTDLSGEAGTNTSRVVKFVKDTAAPKIVGSQVVVDDTNRKEYLEVTFDKDVVLGSTPTPTVDGVGSYVKDFVTTAIGTADLNATPVTFKSATNKKVIRVELDTFLGTTFDVKDAAYTLDLAFDNVKSEAGVAVEGTKATFTRGEDGTPASTAVVAVSNVAQGTDNNKVAVTFDQEVDGASATNVANYKVDGAVVESVSLLPATTTTGSTTQVAILNLKANSNTFTGTRNIEITNVKAKGSTKVMAPYTSTVSLAENVVPTITAAKLTATNKVTLTFSEDVTNADANANDFELLIGGVKVEANDSTVVATQLTGANTLVVTLEANVTAADLEKGLSLKALDTIDVKDAASNTVSKGITVTVQQ